MTTENPSEKDPRPATVSPANAEAEAEVPPEIEQQLTDEQLSAISGGTTSSPGVGSSLTDKGNLHVNL